jgi:hypothetical protein
VFAAVLAAMAALSGCGSEQPALTLVFQTVPSGTDHLQVTLHGAGATFMGPDAGNANVGVSYASGNVIIDIDGAYAQARLYRIRLPLTAGKDITLEGTARATSGADELATAMKSAQVAAGQSATLIFDFPADGGVDPSPAPDGGLDGGDAGGGDAGADDAPLDAADGGPATDGPTDATSPDLSGDAPRDLGDDTPSDAPTDVAIDMSPGDVAPDSPPDVPAEMPPMDSGPDVPPTIGTTCRMSGQSQASVASGGSGPTVAYAGGLFGVVWQATTGLSYNAVAPNGTLQFAQDKLIVSSAGQSLTTPRLARLGSDFVLAYGRRDTSGGQAAVVRFPAATGVAGQPSTGQSRPGASSAPEIGEVAVSADEKKLAVISRPADLSTQTSATVDGFNDALAFTGAKMPPQLGATRTTGIGWVANRFMAGAVTDATSTGGTLVELSDTDLTFQSSHPFTTSTNAPVVGSSTATMSIAGAVDLVAVAWIDLQSGRREVWIAVYSLKTSALVVSMQASVSSTTPKYYPHVVFDGAAFALAWLEANGSSDAQLKLRRFEPSLMPVAAPMNVGPAGMVSLGDFDLTEAGANVYGVADALSTSTQALFVIMCN